jgi:hypothetical protein
MMLLPACARLAVHTVPPHVEHGYSADLLDSLDDAGVVQRHNIRLWIWRSAISGW